MIFSFGAIATHHVVPDRTSVIVCRRTGRGSEVGNVRVGKIVDGGC